MTFKNPEIEVCFVIPSSAKNVVELSKIHLKRKILEN